MGSQQLIPREEWERWLRNGENCRPFEGEGRYFQNGEMWIASNGRVFPVPLEDGEGRMRPDERDQVKITLARVRQAPPKNR